MFKLGTFVKTTDGTRKGVVKTIINEFDLEDRVQQGYRYEVLCSDGFLWSIPEEALVEGSDKSSINSKTAKSQNPQG